MRAAGKTVIAAAFTVLLATPAWATTAGIRGTVKDAAGNKLAGAQILLVLQGFNTEHEVESNNKGKFYQIGLKPGTYDVFVNKDGFLSYQTSIHLALKKREKLDIVLNPVGTVPAGGATSVQILLGGKELSKDAADAYEAAQRALGAGDRETAENELERFIGLEPSIASAYRVLAQLYRDDGDGSKAAEVLERGLKVDASVVDVWVALGEIRTDSGDFDGAVMAFHKAVELDSAHVRATKKLAMAYVMKQDFEGALPLLERYLELAPEAADAGQKRTLLNELEKLAGR